jgi:hypothetical protein
VTFFRRYKFEIAVILIWAICAISKLKFNGLILGFDYGIYQPDGKYYTYMALDILKQNPIQSAQEVVNWYAIHGFKMQIFTVEDLIPSTSPVYNLISHRILYPLLSVPFVAILGIPGMLVIPTLSLLVLMLSIQVLANRAERPLVGLVLVFFLSVSPTVSRWMILNCTDSLLTAIYALVPFAIIMFEKNKKKGFFFLGVLIVLTSATRFTLPIWLAIFGVLYLRKIHRKELIMLIGLSSIAAVPALRAQSSTALLPGETEASLISKVLQLPVSFVKVISIDVLQFGVLDRLLLAILVLAIVQAFRLRRRLSSSIFLGVFFAAYFIGAINGTLGVNFRYQLPVLIFCCWVIIDSFGIPNERLIVVSPVKRHVKMKKAEQ